MSQANKLITSSFLVLIWPVLSLAARSTELPKAGEQFELSATYVDLAASEICELPSPSLKGSQYFVPTAADAVMPTEQEATVIAELGQSTSALRAQNAKPLATCSTKITNQVANLFPANANKTASIQSWAALGYVVACRYVTYREFFSSTIFNANAKANIKSLLGMKRTFNADTGSLLDGLRENAIKNGASDKTAFLGSSILGTLCATATVFSSVIDVTGYILGQTGEFLYYSVVPAR